MSKDLEFFEKLNNEEVEERFGEIACTTPEPNRMIIRDGNLWAFNNDETYWLSHRTIDRLKSGVYQPDFSSDIGYFFKKINLFDDELFILPDSESKNVINEIDKFWNIEDEFRKRGFLHKRGILLWGEPGSGKTCTIHLILKKIIEDDGVAVFCTNSITTTECLKVLRKIEPKRKAIVVMEDLDSLVKKEGEAGFLALLDGEGQIDNVVFLATTNYPEKLDKRLMDRPSRFDSIKYIGMPNRESRRMFLSVKESTLKGEELQKWVDLSNGLGIAHLKEMIISNRCFGIPIEQIVERLKLMHKRKLSSDVSELGFRKGKINEI